MGILGMTFHAPDKRFLFVFSRSKNVIPYSGNVSEV